MQINLCDSSSAKILKSIKELNQIEGIISAEPNYYYEISQLPNDPSVNNGYLWGLTETNGIKASSAWDISQGDKSIRVGIIDTGIVNHVDLRANLVSGWDTFNNNNITTDDTHFHGTHVAGTIGAVGNNNIGIAGVNWNVTLVPLQAADTTHLFSASDVIEAIQWAESKWGTNEQIDVLNYSVGGFGSSTAVREAIKGYHGLFVWAAGNNNSDVDTLISENGSFDLPNLISVGALKSDGHRPDVSDWGYDRNENAQGSNYSSSGKNVNIYAPGDNIFSTVLDNGYDYKSGTSMAAPHVTGVAALMLSVNPNLTARQLKSIIIKSAPTTNIFIPCGPETYTHQRVPMLNAYNAVNYLIKGYEESIVFQIDDTRKEYITVKDNNPMPKLEVPTREGYKFEGVFSTDGTQFYDENMNGVRNWSIMYDTTLYAKWTPIEGSCIAPGSMITLVDGTLKPVEDLTGDEMLLIWDMKTGSFTSAPILFIDYDKPKECNVISLSFSDGTTIEVIYEHAFWDCDLNEYAFLRGDAAQYIGHRFNKQITDDYGNLTWSTVQLTNVEVNLEYTSAYSPVTYSYLCYYVNGMLSMPGATEGLINIFEVDSDTMTYNQEAFENDIETYGLFTYEEFYEMLPVPEEVFNAFNGQYMKIAFGKGILTEEKLSALYSRYSKFFN